MNITARNLQRDVDNASRGHQSALQEQGPQFTRPPADENQRADGRKRTPPGAKLSLQEAPQTAPNKAPPAQQVKERVDTAPLRQIQGGTDVQGHMRRNA